MSDSAGGDSASASSFKLLLLACMVAQNSCVVLVGRHTRSVEKDDMFVVSQFIFITEFIKLVVAGFLESYTSGSLLNSVKENIISKPLDFLRISVPSLLYLVQNTLLYTALTHLSAPLFQVTYQSKILTTALLSVIMLQRKYTMRQWICLGTLAIGVAIVVLGEKKDEVEQEEGKVEQNIFIGLAAVSVACLCSGFAGVYFEKVLKRPTADAVKPVSMWMRNVQLALFSIVIAFGQSTYQKHFGADKDENGDGSKPFLHGFNFYVWVLVSLQAGGGLLIAAIMKYADNVLKGLATGVSVAVSTFLSMILFGTPLTFQFMVGAVIILSSVFFFSNSGAKSSVKKEPSSAEPTKTEMKPMILPR